jgi:3-dehydroquinate dehydratase-1
MPPVRIGRVRIGESPKLVATVSSPQKLSRIAEAKKVGADIVELRLDYLSHWPEEKVLALVKRAAAVSDLPIIATLRAPREGGARRDGILADEKRREAVFKSLIPHVQAVDIELSSSILGEVIAAAHREGKTAIVSYHHFQSTPSLTRLRGLANLCKAKGGDIVKLVTVTHTPVEMIRLLSLLHERPCHPLAAFAMGKHAMLSRLMAHFFQSSLLYAGLSSNNSSVPAAPGQPTMEKMRGLLKQFHLP